jgi:hypothetical protein
MNYTLAETVCRSRPEPLGGINMPDTGERREITSRMNAREAETVQQSKKLLGRTEQLSARAEAKNRARLAETKKARAGTRPSKTK